LGLILRKKAASHTPGNAVLACLIGCMADISQGPQTRTDSMDKPAELKNTDMRFGMWNVRSLYRASLLMTVTKEI
jgi:hypothetical protein